MESTDKSKGLTEKRPWLFIRKHPQSDFKVTQVYLTATSCLDRWWGGSSTSTTTRKLLVFTPWRMETRSWSAGAERDQPARTPWFSWTSCSSWISWISWLSWICWSSWISWTWSRQVVLDWTWLTLRSSVKTPQTGLPGPSWGSEGLPEVGFHGGWSPAMETSVYLSVPPTCCPPDPVGLPLACHLRLTASAKRGQRVTVFLPYLIYLLWRRTLVFTGLFWPDSSFYVYSGYYDYNKSRIHNLLIDSTAADSLSRSSWWTRVLWGSDSKHCIKMPNKKINTSVKTLKWWNHLKVIFKTCFFISVNILSIDSVC